MFFALHLACGAQMGYSHSYVVIKQEFSAYSEGDFSRLQNVHRVNILYDYEDLQMGEFGSEENYIKFREEKFAERGDFERAANFRTKWFEERPTLYEPAFELLFNKYAKKIDMQGVNYAKENEISLVLKAINIDLGSFNGFVAKYHYLKLRATFVDKDHNELCYFYVKGIPGGDIEKCYAKAAKELVILLKEKMK